MNKVNIKEWTANIMSSEGAEAESVGFCEQSLRAPQSPPRLISIKELTRFTIFQIITEELRVVRMELRRGQLTLGLQSAGGEKKYSDQEYPQRHVNKYEYNEAKN